MVDSFNLYFSEFQEGKLKVTSLEDIEAALGGEAPSGSAINANSVLFEFGRQLVQLRETGSISETAFAKFARRSFTS